MTRKRRCTHAATAKPQTRHTATTIQLRANCQTVSKSMSKKGKCRHIHTFYMRNFVLFICTNCSRQLRRTSLRDTTIDHRFHLTPSSTESHHTREPCSPPPRRLRSSREPDDDHQKSMDTSMLRSDPLHTRGSL